MNRWKEFDNIKTPEHWKNISYQKRKIHLRYSWIIVIIICFLSVSTVIAYHDELTNWIYRYFKDEDITFIENVYHIHHDNIYFVSHEYGPFAYEGSEDKVNQVYLIEDNQFKKISPQILKIQYKNDFVSFEYVIYKNHIFAFNFNDNVLDVLPIIVDNQIYISIDRDILSYHFQTQEIKNITNDYQSVNPIMSPQGHYILINKDDQYWSVYDTINENERKLSGINSYAHSNDISFIDEDIIYAYGDKTYLDENKIEHTIMNQINLKTLEVTELDYATDFASKIEIIDNNQTITLKNTITKETNSINKHFNNLTYHLTNKYVLLYDSDYLEHYYLYSIDDNSIIIIDLPEEISDITDIYTFDDCDEILICCKEEFYFINLKI